MIIPQVDIHDKFSLEFKIGFVPDNKTQDINEFKINMWLFVPNSLDINRNTYKKDEFYRNIRNDIRLITPIFTLSQILQEGRGPLPRLQKAIDELLKNTENFENTENYIHQIKMFSCIVKSALRTETNSISREGDNDQLILKIKRFVSNIELIASRYRNIYPILENSQISKKQLEYFHLGDEFLSNIIEQHVFKIMLAIKDRIIFDKVKPILNLLLNNEVQYKKKMSFQIAVEGQEEHNKLVIIKRNLLKKFVESDLYLQTIKRKDGAFAQQLLYSIAAGVAMIFATIIAFAATKRYGNLTTDLFIILVISYMFKDRIKEMMRYYFTSRMSRKYFDNKRKLSIHNLEIGWIKEAFDFISESKIPQDIMNMRNGTPLVDAENEVYAEKIILYRKLVHLSRKDIESYKQYHLIGINDIMRFNLLRFIQKMDNPTIPLYLPDDEMGYRQITGHKEYAIYFILACESNKEIHYKKYRLLFNRNGISDVSELDSQVNESV